MTVPLIEPVPLACAAWDDENGAIEIIATLNTARAQRAAARLT
jgi:hypothetical protein